MFTTYDELQDVVDITKITEITLDEIELDVNKTLELMKGIEIEDLFSGLTIWTKTSRLDRITEYDEFGDEQTYFKETKLKPKTKIKVVPESLKEMWRDPETGMHLPVKTKAYLKEEKEKEEIRQREIEESNKKKYERAKNLIETQLKEVEQFEFNPFTIIVGGMFNRCRYITLPDNFPVPKSAYYVGDTEFYKDMEKTRKYVDFVGLAGMKNNKPCILFKYALNSLKDTKDLQDLISQAMKENKFTLVLGISQESIDRKILDEVIEEIRKELENKQ